MIHDTMLSRRRLLQGSSAALAAGFAGTMPALAKAPMLGTQAPYFYRFKLGNAEGTVVSDGILPLGDPTQAFLGLTKEEIARQLDSNFLPLANAVLEQNALIVNTGSHLVLFDTGMGESMGPASKMWGPTTGKLLGNMRAAGIEPGQIDVVCATHAHCDHVWALVNARGQRTFPNARVAISEADLREMALATPGVVKALEGKGIKTVIVRPPKLVNVVPE